MPNLELSKDGEVATFVGPRRVKNEGGDEAVLSLGEVVDNISSMVLEAINVCSVYGVYGIYSTIIIKMKKK